MLPREAFHAGRPLLSRLSRKQKPIAVKKVEGYTSMLMSMEGVTDV